MTHVLALIPARGGSKGVPRKNVRRLGGRPLFAHAVDAARASRLVTRIVLSTDDEEIAKIGRSIGCEVPFLRTPALAADDTPMLEVVRHTLNELHTTDQYKPDTIVLLQPTTPFRNGRDIDDALTLMTNRKFDAVVSVAKVPTHYSPPWQFILHDNVMRLYGGQALGDIITRRQDLPSTYIRNGAIYAFQRASFERNGSIYGERCGALIMPSERSINIDTPDDWAEAQQYVRRLNRAGRGDPEL